MANLLRRCCECKSIMVNGVWIKKENPHYLELIKDAEHITDGYCPEHLCNNSLRRKKGFAEQDGN